MKQRFETCTVTLTPLSPIHISAGNPDYGWGAVWIEKKERNKQSTLYILDSERFSRKLDDADLLEKYIEAVERWMQLSDAKKSKQSNPCFNFIDNNRKSLYSDKDIITFVKELSITELNAPSSTHFIQNGAGYAYIPGSSIKGAIRTAIIYAILQEHIKQTGIDYLNDYLKEKLNSIHDYPESEAQGQALRKILDNDLLNDVLAEFELTEKVNEGNTIDRAKPKTGSITNLMRAIIVSDSAPILMKRDTFKLEEIHLVMLENQNSQGIRKLKRNSLPVAKDTDKEKKRKQCLQADQNTAIKFKLTIDHEILRSFDFNTHNFPIVFQDIDELTKIITNFYREVWKKEQEYFLKTIGLPEGANSDEEKMIFNVKEFHDNKSETYPNLQPNINIGLGAGILCKTLFIAILPKHQIKIRNLQMTKDQIDNQKRKCDTRGNPVDWINKIAPNSRHVVFRGDRNSFRPLGWANLQFGTVTYEDNVL